MDLDRIPYIPAFWQIPAPGRTVDVIGIHAMETAETTSTAENLGRYFASHPEIVNGTRKASTHYGVDSDSVVAYVPLDAVAYAAGGINRNGVHIEINGYSAQTRAEWLDPDGGAASINLAAQLTAALCARFQIPPVWLDADALKAGRRGITDHATASAAFGGDHWDPGPAFPRDVFMAWVRNQQESEVSLTIHRPTQRTERIWDFTYLPASGTELDGRKAHVAVCIRSLRPQPTPMPVEVWCQGQPRRLQLEPGGITLVAEVTANGLVSVVGDDLAVEARELWS